MLAKISTALRQEKLIFLPTASYSVAGLLEVLYERDVCGLPSTREVRRESSVAFLRPGGRERPIESSLCRRTCPPFFDLALGTRNRDCCRSKLLLVLCNLATVCVCMVQMPKCVPP